MYKWGTLPRILLAMPQLVSVLEDGNDVIAQVLEQVVKEKLMTGKKEEITSKAVNKIRNSIETFMEGNMIPDWYRVEHLHGPIHEFRISLPKSSYLVRILFALERWALVLLTGYLIKPSWYDDKHTTKIVDKEYEQKIFQAQAIYVEYLKKSKTRKYISLS